MKITLRLMELLIVFLCIACAVASCGGTNCKDPANASSVKCTAINAVVTCGGTAVDQLVTEQLPNFEKDLGAAIQGDGSLNYGAAAPVLESYATKFGMCFVTAMIGKLSSLHFAAAPGSASPPRPSPAELDKVLETFRATHYTGTKFELVGSGR